MVTNKVKGERGKGKGDGSLSAKLSKWVIEFVGCQ